MTFEEIGKKREALRTHRKELEAQVARLHKEIDDIEEIEDRLFDEWDRTFERVHSEAIRRAPEGVR